MITRIQKIRNIGLFNKFDWDAKIDDFKKFNAFYGWNGSGKTTISRIFSILETGLNDDLGLEPESSCLITTKDANINISKDIIPLPNKNIKVFNEDFIRNNLEWHNNKAKPILIIGKTKIDQSEKLITTITEKNKLEQILKHLTSNANDLEKDKNKILEKARNAVIKDLAFLSDIKPKSGRASLYRNYTTVDVNNLLNDDKVIFPSLDDESKVERKKILTEKEARQKLDDYAINLDTIDQIIDQIKLISSVTLSSFVMNALNNEIQENEELREWLKVGLKIHLADNTNTCKFCNNNLSKNRLGEIDSFFDEAQVNLTNQIDSLILSISQINFNLPENVEKLYKQFEIEYSKAKENFFIEKQNFEKILQETKLKLQNKRKRIFEKIHIETDNIITAKDSLKNTIEVINKVIFKHNETTEHFFNKRKNSAYELELFLVGQNKEDFKRKFAEIKKINEKRAEIITILTKLEGDEAVLKRTLADHGIAAAKFNQMLNAFLGRSEISLIIANDDYSIMRNGKFAKNLSEGEKNAIALIFFLIKLQEDGFDSSKGIVIIDDPVSSFDSQHTYQAFNFIKSKIKEVNPSQLFLLTHNFHFFRQLRNWYKYEDAKCYHIKCRLSGTNSRYSTIENLDPLLQKHDSEYTFLFKLVYERANEEENVALEKDYVFPNIIRKLLENYLSMKVPIDGINIHSKLTKLLSDFTDEQISVSAKSRIEAYCQDNSHPLYHDSPIDFDERLMGELKQSCQDIINLIKITDARHHFHLVNQIKPNQTEAA